MSINQQCTFTFTQGTDVITKSVYVSGDAKTIFDIQSPGSGLLSGVALSFAVSGLKSLYVNSTVDNQRVKFYGLSGAVTFDFQTNFPLAWASGNQITNPLSNCSGNVTGMSTQQLSGFVSGTTSVHLIYDTTP